jgi:hypothetical protein
LVDMTGHSTAVTKVATKACMMVARKEQTMVALTDYL